MTTGEVPQAPWRCVVVSGVSGSGKTTLARLLAHRLDWREADGDSFHSPANLAKMQAGIPLTDADRAPWLDAIAAWIDEHCPAEGTVVSCSALRRDYRLRLRDGRPWLTFCQVDAPRGLIAERLRRRRGHFMPASLLESQYAALEPLQDDEPGIVVSSAIPREEMVRAAIMGLGLEG